MVMSLKEWLKSDYGVDFHADPGMGGDAQAAALFSTLEAAGLDYGLQRAILLEAGDRHQVLSFGTACLDRVDAIDAYLARRAATAEKEVRRCHSRVSKNKDWAAGAEYADLRFAAARTVCHAHEGRVQVRDLVGRSGNRSKARVCLGRKYFKGQGHFF